jgi:OmpA-OmpF porin, OOP family
MKLKLTLLLVIVTICTNTFAQKKATQDFPYNKKGQLFGIHTSVSDFVTPQTFKNSPTTINRSERKFPNIRDMSFGLGVSYWKGLTPKIDIAATLNTIFHDYASLYRNASGTNEIGVELEPTINIRPMADNNRWAPFLSAGIGGGLYSDKVGAYLPVGGGLQLNFAGTTYFFAKMQYHVALTKKIIKDNLYYSIGFAESFEREKPAAQPLPVIPAKIIPEAPKDRDGDGIVDTEDKCPDVKGTAKYNGCPVPDTDGDGIDDETDNCPTKPGLRKYNGCPVPDTDGDGVNDELDRCPTVPGVASNQGCPEVKPEIKIAVEKAAGSIYFATGSDRLLAKSTAPLNNIVKMLQDNADYKVAIEGNTDNTGDENRNQVLSEKRAKVVADYLVAKGIDSNRITSKGNGQNNPVVDNDTDANRAKNRRVEIKVTN